MVNSGDDSQDEGDKVAVGAILSKHKRLMAERVAILSEVEAANKRLRHVDRGLFDCRAAGRLFGIEIAVPEDARPGLVPLRRIPPRDDTPVATGSPNTPPLSGAGMNVEPTIRDIVLDQLKMAEAKGVKASTLRRVVENLLGRQIHYKTIGMTLYRLSERKMAKRQGLTWFFVPPPSGEETKKPGVDAPGSFESKE